MGSIIDLTDEPSTTLEEPPKKKQRVRDGAARKTHLKEELLDHAVPYVRAALQALGGNPEEWREIGLKATAIIAADPHFLARVYATKGQLTPADQAALGQKSRDLVGRLSISTVHEGSPYAPSPEAISMQEAEPQPPPPLQNGGRTSVLTGLETTKTPNSAAAETRLPKVEAEPQRVVAPPPPPTLRASSIQQRQRIIPLRPQKRKTQAEPASNKWFQLESRPYRTAQERALISKGAQRLRSAEASTIPSSLTYHVDFTKDEQDQLFAIVSTYFDHEPLSLDTLTGLCQKHPEIPSLVGSRLDGRSEEDVRNFCTDLLSCRITRADDARVQSLGRDRPYVHEGHSRDSTMASLLLAREMEGNIGFGRTRKYVNFQQEFKKVHEDSFHVVDEFTNGSGDIATITWVSADGIICGATAHSDSHNQQYNKPGNLLLGSACSRTLRAFPDHRIPRPIVEKGENSTEAMRRTQDPWLYCSVVSSDYDSKHHLAYTSSFDKTVKVWKTDNEGKSMTAVATWKHEGNVNFVASAIDGSGRVATAADVPSDAVRIYSLDREDPAQSTFQPFSSSRSEIEASGAWAYFPAALQWGVAKGTRHVLAVGYSPRSFTGDDRDIPKEKQNTGEIWLWDADKGHRIPVGTARTTNVFEIAWHPTHPSFIVATAPSGLTVEPGVRTQIHLFHRDSSQVEEVYMEFQKLDCPASDINELTLKPNSYQNAYITAACTDGRVYVWDTSQGDKPIHVLKHGRPLDEYQEDREREDTGVKFTAWGITLDRFYTGGSDGKVNVWNVRKRRKPYLRELLAAPGPVASGQFSPDMSKLAIGDATGRLFLCSLEDDLDEQKAHLATIPGCSRKIRRPKPIIPHAEPPPPDAATQTANEDDIVAYVRRTYIDSNQLILSGNPVVGAVQGAHYGETGLYRREAHREEDPSQPLLTNYERHQQQTLASSRGRLRRSVKRVKEAATTASTSSILRNVHEANQSKDLKLESLDKKVLDDLRRDGALLQLDEAEGWAFSYEEGPLEIPEMS